MLLLLYLAFVASRETVTYLFTDARYAEMTLAVANDTYRVAHRDPYAYVDHFLVTIWVLDDTTCVRFRPYFCVSLGYSNLSYQSMLEKRLVVLHAALQYPPEYMDGVLMLDSDVVLWRNIAARMEKYGTDLVFQSEWPCASRHCVNGGVWWVRARSPSALRVVERALNLTRRMKIPDQEALDATLAVERASVAYLPALAYPNGFVLQTNTALMRQHVHLAHANWCASDAKSVWLRDLRSSTHWLVASHHTNHTFICNTLRALDTHQIAQILGCRSAAACRAHITQRCT